MNDAELMSRALQLAAQGEGWVEPNPMVGCVIAREGRVIAEGWHRQFGGLHAEREVLAAAEREGVSVAGAAMYVTLEPCHHYGKTPPCTDAVCRSGVSRVVVAMRDPFPQVAGGGIEQLREAGLTVEVGLLENEARDLNAPYLKLVESGRPWTIAKWAMTLDGKIAARTGDSRWISNEQARRVVHRLRGRMDAIVVGAGTARLDDPLLTTRPPGPRTPLRIVIDDAASLSLDSQLVRTIDQANVLIAAAPGADSQRVAMLREAGCEVLLCEGDDRPARLAFLFEELGRRRLTNVLVEGGSRLLGLLLDAGAIDEAHVFMAPKLIGGAAAPSPIGGEGRSHIASAATLKNVQMETLGDNVYLRGRLRKAGKENPTS